MLQQRFKEAIGQAQFARPQRPLAVVLVRNPGRKLLNGIAFDVHDPLGRAVAECQAAHRQGHHLPAEASENAPAPVAR